MAAPSFMPGFDCYTIRAPLATDLKRLTVFQARFPMRAITIALRRAGLQPHPRARDDPRVSRALGRLRSTQSTPDPAVI